MRWGQPYTSSRPEEFSRRYVPQYAYLPTRDWLAGGWVWLEWFVQEEYYSYMFGRWRANTIGTSHGPVVYDCRKEGK